MRAVPYGTPAAVAGSKQRGPAGGEPRPGQWTPSPDPSRQRRQSDANDDHSDPARQPTRAEELDAELYQLGHAAGLAGEVHFGVTSPAAWYAGYQAGARCRADVRDGLESAPAAAAEAAGDAWPEGWDAAADGFTWGVGPRPG